ncbi:hypothetical protein (mitochondrion) [Ogataea philodendri]|uniref:Homing endonuclease LAGLIDADG domain-containing protein n=1 Tax=Ogataea philodendri TaxID=1378263 RepID=S5U5L0_9ASCO|nr:hypothetical protein [Ogataea philodendri]AGS44396.1 hypothetical protein [Ogataea philodendri]
MGYRVSKSINNYSIFNNFIVKEQRVYGSYLNLLNSNTKFNQQQVRLRCTLMAHESEYPIRSLSNLSHIKLHPWFITGLTDAEGCFTLKIGKRIQLEFVIGMHTVDKNLINSLKEFFGIGNIWENKRNNTIYFKVSKIKDLITIIIPHFENYPLQSKKQSDFYLFKQAAIIKYGDGSNKKKRLTDKEVEDIIRIRLSINRRKISENLQQKYPHLLNNPVFIPEIKRNIDYIKDYWIAGFTSGDGGFYINCNENKPYYVTFSYIISQKSDDYELLEHIKSYFNCGTLRNYTRNTTYKYVKNIEQLSIEEINQLPFKESIISYYTVKDRNDINTIIVPFFLTYNIIGIKNNNFNLWVKAIDIVNNNKHLTHEGWAQILEYKYNMNSYSLKKITNNIIE